MKEQNKEFNLKERFEFLVETIYFCNNDEQIERSLRELTHYGFTAEDVYDYLFEKTDGFQPREQENN